MKTIIKNPRKRPLKAKTIHLNNDQLSRSKVFKDGSQDLYESYIQNTEYERAYQRYKEKPFAESNKAKKTLAILAGWLMQMMGAFLAVFALNQLLSTMIPYFSYREMLTITLSSSLLLLLEFAKRVIWNELFLERYKKAKISIGLLLLSVVLFALSAGSSTIGCYQLTVSMADSTKLVLNRANQKVQNLETDYNTQIKSYQDKVQIIEKDMQEKIKKGIFLTIPASEASKIQFYNTQIDQLRKEKNNKSEKVESHTQMTNQSILQNAQRYAWVGFGLSTLFEFMAVLCIAFLAYYDFRVFLEAPELWQKSQKATPVPATISLGDWMKNQLEEEWSKVRQHQQALLSMPQAKATNFDTVSPESENSKPYSNPTIGFKFEPTPKNHAMEKTYPITCPNCGKKENKKSPRAIFCSSGCRISYSQKNKSKTV